MAGFRSKKNQVYIGLPFGKMPGYFWILFRIWLGSDPPRINTLAFGYFLLGLPGPKTSKDW